MTLLEHAPLSQHFVHDDGRGRRHVERVLGAKRWNLDDAVALVQNGSVYPNLQLEEEAHICVYVCVYVYYIYTYVYILSEFLVPSVGISMMQSHWSKTIVSTPTYN